MTAARWGRLLRQLGHRVKMLQAYHRQECDLLVALHARRSFPSVWRFRQVNPGKAVVVAMTGTDLYRDMAKSPRARRSLGLATRLVVLQPRAIDELPEPVRARTVVIYQSMPASKGRKAESHNKAFPVCVLGHLRPVKDPFRAARAARLLPPASGIRIVQIGAALKPAMAGQARAEERRNPRYQWLGELPRWAALRRLARSRLLVLSSRMEGGANVLSEAIAASVPVLASRIDGSVGILGADYPGLFPVGDTQALADLMYRAETDGAFYRSLLRRCRALQPLFDPKRELRNWKTLLRDL